MREGGEREGEQGRERVREREGGGVGGGGGREKERVKERGGIAKVLGARLRP